MEIAYITSNAQKFEIISMALRQFGVELVQKTLDLPEIQSKNVEEVARATALLACEKLDTVVITTDAGCFIRALGGFPGPYLKDINSWLSAEDYLNLMRDKSDRYAEFQEAIACVMPGKEPFSSVRITPGEIAKVVAPKNDNSSINQIFIPNGETRAASEIPPAEVNAMWARSGGEEYWKKVADYLLN